MCSDNNYEVMTRCPRCNDFHHGLNCPVCFNGFTQDMISKEPCILALFMVSHTPVENNTEVDTSEMTNEDAANLASVIADILFDDS